MQIHTLNTTERNPLPANTSDDSNRAGDRALTKPAPETDPDLTRVMDAWPGLPEPIRRAILALVDNGR
jgi:hypothetical protein